MKENVEKIYTEKEIDKILEESKWHIDSFQRCSSKNCIHLVKIVEQLRNKNDK